MFVVLSSEYGILENDAYYCYFFLKKIDFDISYRLSPLETICMKYQNVVSGEKYL